MKRWETWKILEKYEEKNQFQRPGINYDQLSLF